MLAGGSAYRISNQRIKILVGTAVTTAQVSYTLGPQAGNDYYTIDSGGALGVSAPGVLANDSAPGGAGSLSASLVTGPAHGTLSLSSNGGFNYVPATNYSGVAHPSEPNYIALFSGSTQGVTDDANYDIAGQNLADQLEAHGKTWKMFAQNVPPDCSTAATATGGEDGSGSYARKHEPAISFTDISTSPARCANITDFTHFDPAAADFEFITPNMCHDMHDCPIATGDAFLRDFVPTILNSPAWQQGGVLFITWDENEGRSGNHVPTLVISPNVAQGFQSNVAHDHYSLLRTIEDAWGLGCLNKACAANNLNEFFH